MRKAAAKAVAAEVEVGAVAVETLEGWEKLTPSERKMVVGETAAISGELATESKIKLAVGRHLAKVQAMLEPKRMFGPYLDLVARAHDKSTRTLYRYIEDYKEAESASSPHAVEAAIERGVDLTGRAAKKAMATAPPLMPTSSRKEAEEWVEHVNENKKQVRKQTMPRTEPKSYTPEESLKDCYKLIAARFAMLPQNPKTRSRWVGDLVGYILTMLGVGSARSFEPQAIPQEWRTNGEQKRRGRPPRKPVASAPIYQRKPPASVAAVA